MLSMDGRRESWASAAPRALVTEGALHRGPASVTVQAMNLREVDRRYGDRAKWVWSARPRYVLEADGSERPDLQPVDEVTEDDLEDETGWWTCDPRTEVGDLAVIYRSSGTQDPDYAVRGPKDLAYVALVTSDAFPLDDDPFAIKEGFAEKHGCRCVIVAKIEPPVALAELRADRVLRDWPALRAGFVRAAMSMPDEVWQRFVDVAAGDQRPPSTPRRPRRPPMPPLKRRWVERQLETWLAEHLEVLRPHGFNLEFVRRQAYLSGHEGTLDLLCRRTDQPDAYVVVELKVGEVLRDAVGQVLGYLGWMREQPEVAQVDGVLIGGWPQTQLPYALSEVDERVSWLTWGEIDLPQDLRDLLE